MIEKSQEPVDWTSLVNLEKNVFNADVDEDFLREEIEKIGI